MYEEDDEDERKDKILQMLNGEVDDFAGSQLKNPDEKPSQGVTIEISVKPHGGPDDKEIEKEPDEEDSINPSMVDGNGEHDPIAHILGLHSGGCAGK